jgi:hypothetical protein
LLQTHKTEKHELSGEKNRKDKIEQIREDHPFGRIRIRVRVRVRDRDIGKEIMGVRVRR